MSIVHIRDNPQPGDPPYPWRVVVDGEEKLAKSVEMRVPSLATLDRLPTGEVVRQITCEGSVSEIDGHLTICRQGTAS